MLPGVPPEVSPEVPPEVSSEVSPEVSPEVTFTERAIKFGLGQDLKNLKSGQHGSFLPREQK